MKRSMTVLAMVLLVMSAPLWAADTWKVDGAHSEVEFKVRHLMSKVSGSFNEFDGEIVTDFENLENSSVKFTIKTASVDTRNGQRDDHLRSGDFFDVEKYPEISFVSSSISKASGDTYDVKGTFTMHGVSKEITLAVTFLGSAQDPWGNTKAGFAVETTLNRKDYGMVWNKALDAGGYILGEDVAVEINLQASKVK